MEPSPRKKTTPYQDHLPITRVAARALADNEIPVVEYGQQIQWRNGYPAVLMRVEWAVPDTFLSRSSEILSGHGFPRVQPVTKVTDRYGQWDRSGIIHKLCEGDLLLLYPLSFVGLALHDTVEVTSTFDPTLTILTPKLHMYMLSLIRHLLNHPVGDSSRLRVEKDLLSFISFYILQEELLDTKNGEPFNEESEKDFQKRIEDAVREIKTWDWGANGNNYCCIAESLVRDCRSIKQLSGF